MPNKAILLTLGVAFICNSPLLLHKSALILSKISSLDCM
ncbi:hypothetical protein PCIT_b0312 [Pseudoalteromonas citrea]|uniref:Uncharacterized protein n=1 Tax=Pseudoalteromonas citrea TaxID=43655 RepID=A0AAD4AEA1_9GAMM|nr:hypothetical protein PCIT_b0312 [Pseudoalteromonas citrea]